MQSKTRIYNMLAILRASRTANAKRLINLIIRFYAITLADCKDVIKLSGTLFKINNKLRDLYFIAAFIII